MFSGLVAQLVGALLSGLRLAKHHRFEPRTYPLHLISTTYILLLSRLVSARETKSKLQGERLRGGSFLNTFACVLLCQADGSDAKQ